MGVVVTPDYNLTEGPGCSPYTRGVSYWKKEIFKTKYCIAFLNFGPISQDALLLHMQVK